MNSCKIGPGSQRWAGPWVPCYGYHEYYNEAGAETHTRTAGGPSKGHCQLKAVGMKPDAAAGTARLAASN